jgi:hypothetical protein
MLFNGNFRRATLCVGSWVVLTACATGQPVAAAPLKWKSSAEPWTRDISHGKLIRDVYDETLTVDPENMRMLFQGRDPESGPITACPIGLVS